MKKLKQIMQAITFVLDTPAQSCETQTVDNGNVLIFSDTSKMNLPAFFVIDEANRPFDQPFRRICEDGKFGWYTRNTSNGYTFLMPAFSDDFEHDKLNGANHPHAQGEPMVTPFVRSSICECSSPLGRIGSSYCMRCGLPLKAKA
jgi:hypothetical protein